MNKVKKKRKISDNVSVQVPDDDSVGVPNNDSVAPVSLPVVVPTRVSIPVVVPTRVSIPVAEPTNVFDEEVPNDVVLDDVQNDLSLQEFDPMDVDTIQDNSKDLLNVDDLIAELDEEIRNVVRQTNQGKEAQL